jgi:hypothetical protein
MISRCGWSSTGPRAARFRGRAPRQTAKAAKDRGESFFAIFAVFAFFVIVAWQPLPAKRRLLLTC